MFKILRKKLDDSLEIKHAKKFTPQQREIYKTIGGTPHLDGRYAVFGEVTECMDVVDKITNLPTTKQDRPIKDMKMMVRIVSAP